MILVIAPSRKGGDSVSTPYDQTTPRGRYGIVREYTEASVFPSS